MAYSVSNNRLFKDGAPSTFVATPNRGDTLKPLYLIIHYTADTSAKGAISWFQHPEAQASAHLVIDRNGSATQMVEFNRIAWHAGKSAWQGLERLNAYSIGIELVNGGKLRKNGSGKWQTYAGTVIPDAEVVVATHERGGSEAGWHRYSPEQIEATLEIGLALRAKYKLADVLGHDDVSWPRKADPGPAFPMTSVAGKILGRR